MNPLPGLPRSVWASAAGCLLLGWQASAVDLAQRAPGELVVTGLVQAEAHRIEGATELKREVRAEPRRQRHTRILLVAPDGDARSVREAARGWVAGTALDDQVELVGLAPSVRGPDALREALAETFSAPLPEVDPSGWLVQPGGPDERRLLVTTRLHAGLPELPSDGTEFVILYIRPPGLRDRQSPVGVRSALRQTGGDLLVADDVDEAEALLAAHQRAGGATLSLTLCGGPGVLIDPAGERTELPPLPPCAAAPTQTSTPSQAGGIPWGLVGGGAFGLVVLVGGGAFLLRKRPPAPAHATAAEPEVLGRLLVTVNAEADARLYVKRGRGLEGRSIPLAVGSLSVGAAPGNDALVELPGISGRHARFERFPTGDIFVLDADSTNGTWVSGRRLERGERARLRSGDRIGMGTSLEVELVLDGEDA